MDYRDSRITPEFCIDCCKSIHQFPEKAGANLYEVYVDNLNIVVARVKKLTNNETAVLHVTTAYNNLYYNWFIARSKMLSSQIIGPANFPVKHAETANRIERIAGKKLSTFSIEKTLKRVLEVDEINEIKEFMWALPNVVCRNNLTAERVQIKFECKPSDKICEILKSNAFKWAPSIQAWQRKNTFNGLAHANFIYLALKELHS